MCVDNCYYVHNSLLLKYRFQKAHLAQARQSRIPQPLPAGTSLHGTIAYGAESGLCRDVPGQTLPGAKQHVPGEESLTHFRMCLSSSWLFSNRPALLQLLAPFLFFLD